MATSQARAVCVVDDDVSLPRALQILLRAAGFTVGAVGIGGGVLARGPGCGRPLLAVKRVSDRDGSARAAPRPRAGARAPRSRADRHHADLYEHPTAATSCRGHLREGDRALAQRRSSRMGTCTRVADETRRAHHRQLRGAAFVRTRRRRGGDLEDSPRGPLEARAERLLLFYYAHAPPASALGSLVARRAAVPVPHRTKAR